jgi:hypothetical protein
MIAGMKFLMFPLLLILAGCGANPAALGITGGSTVEQPPDPGEVQTGIPGSPQTGTQYAPSLGPNTGAGKFWGYN